MSPLIELLVLLSGEARRLVEIHREEHGAVLETVLLGELAEQSFRDDDRLLLGACPPVDRRQVASLPEPLRSAVLASIGMEP